MMKEILISATSSPSQATPTPTNSSPSPVSIHPQLSSEPSQQGRGPVVVGDEGDCSPDPAPISFQKSTDPISPSTTTSNLSLPPAPKLSSDPSLKFSSKPLYLPPQLSSEPPQQQEVRDPAVVVGDVGSFPSHDIREKSPPSDVHSSDCRPLLAIIEEMTTVSRERKGEDFLPNLRRSENKYSTCVICSRGSICLGNACLGTSASITRRGSSGLTATHTCIIPGLAGDKVSSLLEREKTPSSQLSKVKISPECSQILTWRPAENQQTQSHPVEETRQPVHITKAAKIVGGPATNYDKRNLRKTLLSAKLKASQVQKTNNLKINTDKSVPTTSSLLRKLRYSEISCQRKASSPNKLPAPLDVDKPNNSESFQISKIKRHPTWGHLLIGLRGGAPPLVVPQAAAPVSAHVSATEPSLPPHGETLPSPVVAPDSLPGPALPLPLAASDNPAATPGRFECKYCVSYSTDINAMLKRHQLTCKKKKRNKTKVRSTSVPRNKEALTQNLAPGDTREFVEYESSPGSSSKLCLEKCKLLKKELDYNREVKEVLAKSSATEYDKYMICRAANICMPGIYPFVNIRSNSKNFNKVSKYCLTDVKQLIRIIQSSPELLSEADTRKFVLADTFIGIKDLSDYRGKELRPNAFKNIEVISTANPNHVKLVLNRSEEAVEACNESDSDDENWSEECFAMEHISVQDCWGRDGWLGVIKKTTAELDGGVIPHEIAVTLAEIDLNVIQASGESEVEEEEEDNSEPMDSQASIFEIYEHSDSDDAMELEVTPSPIQGQLDGMVPVLPPFVPAIPIPNIPGAQPQIQPLHQHLQIPVGPGLPPNGQFGLVGPFIPRGPANVANPQVLIINREILASLNRAPNMTYKDAYFLFTSILNFQTKFRPLANPAYYHSGINDIDFHDLTGVTKLQFYDLRNRLEFCGLDFSEIYKGNIDSELFRTLCYVRNIISQRSLAGLTGVSKTKLQNHNWAIIISVVLNTSPLPQFLFFNGNNLARIHYNNVLAAVTRRHSEQYEIYRPLCRNGELLIVAAMDSTKYRAARSNDITARKATFCGYTAENDYTQMTAVDLDGNLIWASGLLNSRTPQHGDGNISVDQILREQQNNLHNGLWSLICISPGFILVLLADKGFAKNYLNPNGNVTLRTLIGTRNNQAGHRIHLFTPIEPGDNVYDTNLVSIGPDPRATGFRRRLTAMEANTSRVLVTNARSVVELSYSSHAQFRGIRKHEAIEYQLLEPLDDLCPYFGSQPKWWMISMFIWSMINRYNRPFSQTFDLPPGYSYASLGRTMRGRIDKRNPYDSLEGIVFPINLWNPRGVPHLAAFGGWTHVGGAGLLSPALIGLPQVPEDVLVEITLGSFQVDQAFVIANGNRTEEVLNAGTYTNMNDFHHQASGPPQDRTCFYYDLLARPNGWIDHIHGPFVPHRILKIPRIHSSHSSTNQYDVIIGFVPVQDESFPIRSPNRFNFTDARLANSLIGWCCGPAADNKCPVGARQVGCCSHVAYCLVLGLCVGGNPNLWKNKHQYINAININRDSMAERSRVELMLGIGN